MIHITLTDAKSCPADDALGRTRYGYSAEMTPSDVYDLNHGYYVLGARADRERYALFSAPDQSAGNKVVLAVEIQEIVPVEGRPDRRVINGDILQEGHPVFDAYVGRPSPISGVRNPVTYLDSPLDRRLCECGCRTEVARGLFVPGHDQRALHERIATIGTVADFLRWFDELHNSAETQAEEADPELRHGRPRVFRREGWGLDKYEWPTGLELFVYDDGRVKLGCWDSSVAVVDVSNFAKGKSRASAHVVARFSALEGTASSDSSTS
ncbi:hypothetical protein [Nonomuraea dietziae]|uniref:hypothetical protein n=1 Tax=Nonomuraea dietziae TaxID=65515 RepID=UPI003402C834